MKPTLSYQNSIRSVAVMLAILFGASAALAQTTSFTYQGRLTDSGSVANGNYDLQFALWDSLSGGAQVGSTQTLNAVAVSNGVFTVSLDFGANAFPGASRFLGISARPAGSGSFVLLSPRQPITSTPYAVRSLRAATADSVPASGVPAGSGNYIQNTTLPQSANFNISGSATVRQTLSGNVVNAATQFDIGGNRVFTVSGNQDFPDSNVFAGVGAGHTTGINNAFFGSHSGFRNTGSGNTFLGGGAGSVNTTGVGNTFVGFRAGFNNDADTGSFNTLLGVDTSVTSGVNFSTAIGFGAQVTQSNSLVLGRPFTNVGISTSAPLRTLQIGAGVGALFTLDPSNASPNAGFIRFGDNTGWKLHFGRNREFGGGGLNPGTTGVLMTIQDDGRVGIGTQFPDQTLSAGFGNASKPGGGSWATFSDERLKSIKGRFTPGLHAVMQLHPLRYEYKRDNALNLKSDGEHIGFSAQAVQKIIPQAVTSNDQGYMLINNDPILWTMLNAIKEQQTQIAQQQQQIKALKKLVCRSRRRAAVCK